MKYIIPLIISISIFSCGTPAEQLLHKVMSEEQTVTEFEQAIVQLDLTKETADIRKLVFYSTPRSQYSKNPA